MKSHTMLICFFCVITFCMLESLSADEFKPLFNGENLDGWQRVNTDASTWSVKDGMLICTGKPIGELRTTRMYQNFVLEVEWRHMKPRGNAGIFVWADDITAPGVPFHRSIEVQVLENAYGNTRGYTTHGDIFPIHGAKMEPVNGRGGSRAFPIESRSKPSPQWNHYRIECREGEISLAVNGKVVTRGKKCRPSKGYICIESEGGVVHYRNMRILELPDTKIAKTDIAIADRGYRCLYTGMDLDGWTVVGKWKPQDWQIKYESNEAGILAKALKSNDVGFICDLRSSAKAEPTVFWRGTPVRLKLNQNKWVRVEGHEVNNELVIKQGGVPVPAAPLTKGDNQLKISAKGAMEVANIYVRGKRDGSTAAKQTMANPIRKSGFRFLATGDMPYNAEQNTKYRKLVAQSAEEDFAFLVHVGDFRGGGGACSDSEFQIISDLFAAYPKPVVYSIGDNEWTDCEVADTAERAEKLREIFFRNPQTLRLNKLGAVSQSSSETHSKFIENYRFEKSNVMFVVLHVVGSGNNYDASNTAKMKEFAARNEATLAFLNESFDLAKQSDLTGLALIIHANPSFETGGGPGHKPFLDALRDNLKSFHKPTICIHGDSHYFRIDKPFKDDANKTIFNFTRIEVFGSPNVAGLEIRVDPLDPQVFQPRPYFLRTR